MIRVNGRPGEYRARNRNTGGRRIFFAMARSKLGGGYIDQGTREVMAVIAEGVKRGEEA